MKSQKDIIVIIAITIIIIVVIMEIGKSIRISQLKKIDESKIESMGQYEEKSKNDYLKPFEEKVIRQNKE
ncbi:hypothetical protein [Winogradskyella sp.]|uniref:hypothetical protein n=1 Tax=Winogradskyella sp. TaxID=1883156 RepID=UPI002638689C|nr:hypothetical protein [uncultured Winogradskyella sp.]